MRRPPQPTIFSAPGFRSKASRFALLLAAGLAGAARSRALDPGIGASDYLAQAWQTEGGLPSNRVRAIRQTADGYLWVATQAGAARFDGDHFEIFNHSTRPELPVSAFLALAETSDGTLWLGSNEGLFSWRAGRFKRYSTADGLASNHVQALAEAANGELVVGTDRSITLFRGGHGDAPGRGWDQVRGIVRAYVRRADGSEFIGTDEGVWHTAGGSGADAGAPAPLDLPGSSFNCILDAPDGLWVGSSLGLYHLRRDGRNETIGTAQGLTNLRVLCLLRDRDGNLWIGTGGGLFRLRDGRIEAASYPGTFGTTTIQCLCEDHDGTLWVGSFSGLFALRNRAVTAVGSREGLPNTGVTAVLEARDGAWWIGTWSGGVFRYEPRRGITPWGQADASPTDHVLSFAETGDGALWIGGTRTALRLAGSRTDNFLLPTEEERLPRAGRFHPAIRGVLSGHVSQSCLQHRARPGGRGLDRDGGSALPLPGRALSRGFGRPASRHRFSLGAPGARRLALGRHRPGSAPSPGRPLDESGRGRGAFHRGYPFAGPGLGGIDLGHHRQLRAQPVQGRPVARLRTAPGAD